MAPEIRNPDQNIDILLELGIGHQGQVEAICEHLAVRKTPDLPDLRFIQVTRRAVSCRVIPNTGCLAEVGSEIVLIRGGCSSLNFSKSVNSFGPTLFFYKFSRSMLSIRAAKSPNEFETKALTWTKGWGHGTENRNSDRKIDILLELKMHNRGKKYARRRPPTCPKNTGFPRSDICT